MKNKKFLSVLLVLTLMLQLFGTSLVFAADETEVRGEESEMFSVGSGSPDDYDGSDMWLRYVPVSDPDKLTSYKSTIRQVFIPTEEAAALFRFSDTDVFEETYGVKGLQQPEGSEQKIPKTTLEAAKNELDLAFSGMLGGIPTTTTGAAAVSDLVEGSLVVGTPETSAIVAELGLDADLDEVGDEGYIIKSLVADGKQVTVIAGNTEIGALYGTYAFLRLMQTEESITNLDISDYPKINHRRINSWDKERMYAGNDESGFGKNGLNGESGFLFNWDLSIPGSNIGGNNAHSNAAEGALLMPNILDRYVVAARALASVGINEFNLNNVNSNSAYISEYVIRQEAALADLLRPYGIRLCLSTNYGAPVLALPNQDGTAVTTSNGGNPGKTVYADDTDPICEDPSQFGRLPLEERKELIHSDAYAQWWYDKTVQIMKRIPDFAGYTVKANSEGQAGPQDYGDTHSFGANNMAKLLNTGELEGKGITVFWRSFVYEPTVDNDRLNRAYMEFGPADDPEDDRDEPFLDNVFVQTKNGPLDFQAREIFHPMFGRMPNTNQAIEFQITLEYLGHSTYMTFLGPLYEEVLKSDTYANGPGTLVGNILDGSAQGHSDTAMVGVNNMGNHENFTGNNFLQANTYTFGRQAWDWTLNSEDIATEWTKMTWSNDEDVVNTIVEMMMGSREAVVASQNPIGLIHQQLQNGKDTEHYAPGQWDFSASQDDWTPAYYNKAMKDSIGFRRTVEGRVEDLLPVPEPGSIDEKYYPLVNQFYPELTELFSDIDTCPEEYLLTFHNVSWDHVMKNGNTLWEELIYKAQMGVQYATYLRETWAELEGVIDQHRWEHTMQKLIGQEYDMAVWRDLSAEYWCLVSGRDMPTGTAPLSIQVSVAGNTQGGFDLNYGTTSKEAADPWEEVPDYITGFNSPKSGVGTRPYIIYVPAGTTVPKIDRVIPYNSDASYEIVKQAKSMDDTAVVKVTAVADLGAGVMGHIVQNYTFAFQYDTTLEGITVDGLEVTPFSPDKTDYQVYTDAEAPVVEVETSDPAATADVVVNDGVATITVTNGDAPATVYTVQIMPGGETLEEEFTDSALDSKWTWVREDDTAWSLSDVPGAMTITAGAGDLRGENNSVKNILLTDAPQGDWIIESKLNFSRKPMVDNEQGGIIAYLDDDNYIMFNWKMRNSRDTNVQNGTHGIDYVNEQGGKETIITSWRKDTSELAAGLDQDQIWLRLEKRGDSYFGYFSNNGKDWKPGKINSGNQMVPGTAQLAHPEEITKVGMVVMNGNADVSQYEPMKVSFDYFKVTPICETLTEPTPPDSGSSGSSARTYSVTVPSSVEHGKVAVSTKRAEANSTVTVTVTPDEGYVLNELAVTGADGKKIEVTAGTAGKYTFKMPSQSVNIAVSFVKRSSEAAFNDVAENAWYFSAVEYAVDKGFMAGVTKDTFAPDATLTRAQLAQMLYALEGAPAVTQSAGFTDVAESAWYAKAVNWAAAKQLVSGYGGGLFGPDDPITREQLAAILCAYAKSEGADVSGRADLSGYKDIATLSSWAGESMGWAVKAGLVGGMEDGTLAPIGTATRAQTAQIFKNLLEKVL